MMTQWSVLFMLGGPPAVALAESSLDDCGDGVDNDGDGLTDLNDEGCDCGEGTELFESIESFIANESFEDYSSCPTAPSELSSCDDWQQATNGTSDYYACGLETEALFVEYIGTFPTPPDGTAFAGAIMEDSDYVEYVGGCTTATLEAGTDYTFEMHVAAPVDGGYYGGDTSGSIVLFGVPTCGELPIASFASLEGSVDVLDEQVVNLIGGDPYQLVTFTFTPTTTYEAVVFGPKTDMTFGSDLYGNYVLFDLLTLNATTSFGTEITLEGDCDSGVELTAPEPVGMNFQWYRDGLAVPGATSSSYVPATDGSEDGVWQVRVDNGSECNLVTNSVELQCVLDEDGDGILDEDEDVDGDGDWTNDDTDGDGIPDYLDEDDDGDGVATADELDSDGDGAASGTLGDDSDGDGVDDYLDEDDDNDGLPTADESTAGSDPLDEDSDDDGLSDGEEVNEYNTDVLNPDTDGDGLTDGEEANTHGTDPTEEDTDGGGVSDGQEVLEGTDPLDPADDPGNDDTGDSNPDGADTGDGNTGGGDTAGDLSEGDSKGDSADCDGCAMGAHPAPGRMVAVLLGLVTLVGLRRRRS